ncbi:MAG: YceD family protein [Candidatus Izemoplasmatales bacterium]|jgi:uncharacterized protein|nr:YceD family protein [Candidatus Izemoplasmatales bacterium]MDD3865903.1 YceD family protein [Candidatus Izemoplasmatales bacterium]
MKWSTGELRKLAHIDNQFKYTADLKTYINDDCIDLVDISQVSISGSFQIIEDLDQFVFNVEVECTLTMLCAITLVEVEVPLHFTTDLVFGHELADDNMYEITGSTIDLDPFIFANILIEMPMKVVSEHAYDDYSEPNIVFEATSEQTNSPFAKLKK